MQLKLNKGRLLWACFSVLVAINIGHASAHYLITHHPSGLANAMEALFDFDREGNLSTLYNGLLILWAGMISGMISIWRKNTGSSHWFAWAGIALIFGFLFVDELCGIHDSLDFVLLERFKTSGAFAWPWVIAYGALTLFVSTIYLPFFLQLPRRFQVRFGLSAFLFVAGAIGLEMVAAKQVFSIGHEGAIYPFLVAIEESLEMGALLLAAHSLIHYLERECPGFQLSIVTSAEPIQNLVHHAEPSADSSVIQSPQALALSETRITKKAGSGTGL